MDDALREAAKAIMTAGKPRNPDRRFGGVVCYGPSYEIKNGTPTGGGPRERERMLKEQGLIDIGGCSERTLQKEFEKIEASRESAEEKAISDEVDAALEQYDDSFWFRPGESDTGDNAIDRPVHRDDLETFVGEGD